MARLVQKFGGTSLGCVERIGHVADIIIKAREAGHQIAVVVSAMSGETDRLIDLSQAVAQQPNPREYAVLVSSGEQVSMSLLCMALIARGHQAKSYTGFQAKIRTDSEFKKARIHSIDVQSLNQDLEQGIIPVIAGFQGYDELGNITTLGRGGSDTSAVALAASLEADECQIYTDVDGVYTTDPRVVPEARRLQRITFEEMLELASLGAKVLQIRAVEFAGKYNVPLRVLSSFEDGPGTLISYEDDGMEHPCVSGVAFNRQEAKLSLLGVPDSPGIASHILEVLSRQGIELDMIVQNIVGNKKTDFSFTVHREDFHNTQEVLRRVARELKAEKLEVDEKIAKLSVVGVGLRSHSDIAGTMFQALAQEGINIQLISTSEIKISVIIEEQDLEKGVRALHTAFSLDTAPSEEWFISTHNE